MKKILSLGILGLALSASSAYAQLSGVKTINPNGSGANNYTSFTAAVNALKVAGVNGAVTFNVAAGVYAERVVIDSAATAGASATNQIIFRKDPAAEINPLFRASSTTGVVGEIELLRMANAKWVTIDGIDFQATGDGTATANTVAAIRFTALQYCTFKNFTIRGTGLYNARGINSGNFNATIPHLKGKSPSRHVTIENIRVVNVPTRSIQIFANYAGEDGTDINQMQHQNRDRYNKVVNCKIDSSGLHSGIIGVVNSSISQGMLLLGQDSMTVADNMITNTIHSPTVPVAGGYHIGISVRSNPEQGHATGNIISNNTFSGAYGTEPIYGINIWRSVGTIARNNIVENIEARYVYGIYNSGLNASLLVSHNTIKNLRGGFSDCVGILSVGDSLLSVYSDNNISNLSSNDVANDGNVLGLDIQNAIGVMVIGNKIDSIYAGEGEKYAAGIRTSAAISKDGRPNGGSVHVYNNFISNIFLTNASQYIGNNIGAYGIRSVNFSDAGNATTGGRQYISHNTVLMNRPDNAPISYAAASIHLNGSEQDLSDHIYLENNLILNKNIQATNADTSYLLNFAGGGTLHAKGNNYVGANGTTMFTVQDKTHSYPYLHHWISSGNETNADSAAVTFVNAASGDLHLQASNYSNTRLLKTAVSYVPKDIDGANRNATTLVGADADGGTPNPTPTILGNSTFCQGANTILSVFNPVANTKYVWSNGAIGASISVNTAGQYTVQAISVCCTSAISNSYTVTMAMLSAPSAPTVISNGATTFCRGGSIELNVQNPAANTIYLWSNGHIGTTMYAHNTGNYAVRAISNTCTSLISNATAVTVKPLPVAIISQNGNLLSVTETANSTYQWLINGQPIANATGSNYTTLFNGNYSVRVTLNGCVVISSNVVVSTKNRINTSVKVYPNPSTGTVNLEVSENIVANNATYSITNALGQVIKSGVITETKTTLHLSQGVYFLQINSREGVATKQVVVQ